MNIVFLQYSMNTIKVEPTSDSETCPAPSLCYDQCIGEKLGDQNVPTAFALIKTEVKVRYDDVFFFVGNRKFYYFYFNLRLIA
jgi:hypothetical protein